MDLEQMADGHVMEVGYSSNTTTSRKRKADTAADGNNDGRRATLMKRIKLSLTKPSFVLGLAPKMVRAENRIILRNALHKLMRQQNWVEASGVLSMLLQGTLRDNSPFRNRLKYSASMELLKHKEGDRLRLDRIRHIFDIWMKKNGPMKHWPIELLCGSRWKSQAYLLWVDTVKAIHLDLRMERNQRILMILHKVLVLSLTWLV